MLGAQRVYLVLLRSVSNKRFSFFHGLWPAASGSFGSKRPRNESFSTAAGSHPMKLYGLCLGDIHCEYAMLTTTIRRM